VVRILDDGISEDGQPFLVMELLRGESMDEALAVRDGRLSVQETIHVGDGVLAVLEKAHGLGIVHRDLKPENLFVTRAGEVKVLDFGIARLLERTRDASHTRTGVVMGTPAFMAPEQALGRWSQVDERTDIWAVGAILYLLVSGRLVHGAATGNEMLIRAATQPAPSLARVPGVPLPLVRVVDRALAYDKQRRFPDAKSMRAELAKLAAALDDGSFHHPAGTGSRPPPSPYEAATIAPSAGMNPALAPPAVPSDASPTSPRVTAPQVEGDSIVDERFAHSVVASYLEALPLGQAATVTAPLRAGLRRMAGAAPDAALKMLHALYQAMEEIAPPNEAKRLLHSFASAIVSTRALKALLTSADQPDVNVSSMLQALKPVLAVLGDEHAGVALEVLPTLAEGELKEIVVDYAARASRGYEHQLGGLFEHAPEELGSALVRVLARIDTPAARDALSRAVESKHDTVLLAAARAIREQQKELGSAPAHGRPARPTGDDPRGGGSS
jgi:hypothetical protein